MALETFVPPRDPIIDSTVTFTARVLQAQFGDGYEQTASEGLNSVTGVYTAVWDPLTLSQRDTIEAFFKSKKGAEAFLYTFPSESTPRKFKCKTWSRGHTGGLFTVSAELREVFDLG